MSTPKTVLTASNIAKSFGGAHILRNVSFEIQEGESLAILGPGGSGKSTLLKVLLGIVPPDHGRVTILDQDMANLSRPQRQSLLQQVGMAFQQGALFDFMSVRENILFAMENMTSMPVEEMEDKVAHMLASVNLPHAIHKLPSELSGGMRRRVGIVRALATNPKIALLDEPTAGLDPVNSRIVIDMIHALGKQVGSSLICVTSNVDVAFSFAKRVAILRDGNLIADGTWESLHALNDTWITHFLDVRGFQPSSENAP
jgi:phospholipid/cholesterol/gamma-HCH transport system ATP-binding protein